MSPNQARFINDLLSQREVPETDRTRLLAHTLETLSSANASSAIDWLLTLPYKTNRPVAQVENEGVYVLDGAIVKMKLSKAGRLYAMKLVEIGGQRLVETGAHIHYDWEYAPQLTSQVRPEHAMTMEQAKEYGIRYGRCLRCGRRLKDAESVERAIGPICGKFFRATA